LNKRVVGWVAQNVKANFAQAVTVTQEYYDDETGEYIPDTYVNEETGEKLEVPNQLNVDKSTLNLTLWGKVKKMNEIINTLTDRITQLESILAANNLTI
jgi:type II secretory pathway component GspD/PulD (secretin)